MSCNTPPLALGAQVEVCVGARGVRGVWEEERRVPWEGGERGVWKGGEREVRGVRKGVCVWG